MSTKQFSTDMTEQFNNLMDMYGVTLLDYLVTWGLKYLHTDAYHKYTTFLGQYPEHTRNECSASKSIYLIENNGDTTGFQWDSYMTCKVKELIKIFGHEVFECAFSYYLTRLDYINKHNPYLVLPPDECLDEDEDEDEYEDEDEKDYDLDFIDGDLVVTSKRK